MEKLNTSLGTCMLLILTKTIDGKIDKNELGEKEEIRNSVSHRILHILMYSPTTKYT